MGPYSDEKRSDQDLSSESGRPSPSALKSRLKLWLPLAAVVLLALILALGPTIFLKLTLARLLPPESGLALNYETARAGFLLTSAEVAGLSIEDRSGGQAAQVLSLSRLRLEGLSPWPLIKLWRGSGGPSSAPVFLAEEVHIQGLDLRQGPAVLNLSQGQMRHLRVRPKPSPGDVPLMFDKLETRDLKLAAGPEKFSFSRLEARGLGQDFLAGLSLRDFYYEYQTGPPANRLNDGLDDRQEFKLDALSLGGLSLEAVRRILTGETGGQLLWSFLAGCDTLELVRGALNRSGEEALDIRSISFDSVSRPDGATGFLRRLDLSVNLGALAANSGDPFWADLRDIAGDRLQADLSLTVDYYPPPEPAGPKKAGPIGPESGRLELAGTLAAPALGRLELTGALAGVTPVKSHYSPSQLLLSTSGWRLESLDLNFEDQGLAAGLYRHLDRTVFLGAPNRQSAANIMDYLNFYLIPDLEYEQGLDNLPALVSEVEAFLLRPRRLGLSARPAPPLPVVDSLTFMSLANQGKYDIIEKLRLTLAVNDRAPIFVAVASGVFKENLPLAPRPMENAFDEDIVTEEDLNN